MVERLLDPDRSIFRLSRNDVLRTSNDYELVLAEGLSIAEQKIFGKALKDPDVYGITRPRQETGRRIVVDRNAALLLLILRDPRPLPSCFCRGADRERNLAQVAKLVLDGVLEVQRGVEFVAGAQAARLQDGRVQAEEDLTDLSRRALSHASRLEWGDVGALTARLYAYPRLPWSPRWARRLARGGVSAFLGLEPRGRGRKWLQSWRRVESTMSSAWLVWQRRFRQQEQERQHQQDRRTFKLYVSPHPEALPDVFETLLRVLADSKADRFKVGSDGPGILRPDKLVVYFDELEHLQACAESLAPEIAGQPAQGVPFAAEVSDDGLLSWGIDPPRREAVLGDSRESWRVWVAGRLAAALVAAQERPNEDLPAWRFALERLRLEGVDVDTWTPSPSLWKSPKLAAA